MLADIEAGLDSLKEDAPEKEKETRNQKENAAIEEDAPGKEKESAATAEELPAVGHHVCDMLTAGLVGNPNPVPAVRGVVTTLAGNGMSKEQAVGLMRASSAVYCPQFARFMGR